MEKWLYQKTIIFLKVTVKGKKLERGEEEGIGRSSAATLTKEDKSIEAESGAMTDYEEEITLPETISSAAASSTTEKLSTLTLEK